MFALDALGTSAHSLAFLQGAETETLCELVVRITADLLICPQSSVPEFECVVRRRGQIGHGLLESFDGQVVGPSPFVSAKYEVSIRSEDLDVLG